MSKAVVPVQVKVKSKKAPKHAARRERDKRRRELKQSLRGVSAE